MSKKSEDKIRGQQLPVFFFQRLQHHQMTVQALQDELRIQRDLNQLLQQDPANQGRDLALSSEPTEENYRRLHAEHERQAKELFLLRKTLEEMELRIDTQKQTLGARDESIKKLLEMLQSKGWCERLRIGKTNVKQRYGKAAGD